MTHFSSLDAQTVARVRDDHARASDPSIASLRARGGEPVRCCMTSAEAGQGLLLANVDLGLPTDSPYATMSPVYLHAAAEACTPAPSTAYPEAWRGRRQVLRGYDERGWIVAAAEHDGSQPELAIEALLAQPDVVQVLSSNALHQCFMLRARAD